MCSQGSRMDILDHTEMLALHEAVVAASLVTSRSALLAGLPRDFIANMPSAATPSAQILEDLATLNSVASLADGTVPLETWLKNAITLAGSRRECSAFSHALRRCRGALGQQRQAEVSLVVPEGTRCADVVVSDDPAGSISPAPLQAPPAEIVVSIHPRNATAVPEWKEPDDGLPVSPVRERLLDVELCIEPVQKNRRLKWRVELRGIGRLTRVLVDALTDAHLVAIDALPPEARSWGGLLLALSADPGTPTAIGSVGIRAVGALIMQRVLGNPDVARHLDRIEDIARRETRTIRFLLQIFDDDDPVLPHLPLEFAYGERFLFMRSRFRLIRCVPNTEAHNLDVGPGSRVLIATVDAYASSDAERLSLRNHVYAVTNSLNSSGFKLQAVEDITRDELRARLRGKLRVDVVYLVCPGVEGSDGMGQLLFRDGPLAATELARWLEDATDSGRTVQMVILCASSPGIQRGVDTSRMAEWLARPGRALATLGFRGGVPTVWTLRFTERLFEWLGRGVSIEEAFSAARRDESDEESRWGLPVLYGRRRDLEGAMHVGEAGIFTSLMRPLNTSRINSVFEIEQRVGELSQLDRTPAASVLRFCRIAWSCPEPPVAEAEGTEALVERLRQVPFALEIASATVRQAAITAVEYLNAFTISHGAALTGRQCIWAVVERALSHLNEVHRQAFLCLAALPVCGVPGEVITMVLGEPEYAVVQRLDQLVRFQLVWWLPIHRFYALHPLLWQIVRERAGSDPDIWQKLRQDAAAAIEELAHRRWWIERYMSSQNLPWTRIREVADATDLESIEDSGSDVMVTSAMEHAEALEPTYARHARVRDIIDAANFEFGTLERHWSMECGPSGLQQTRYSLHARLAELETAVREDEQRGNPDVNVQKIQRDALRRHGDISLRSSNLGSTASSYQSALEELKASGDIAGQASALSARGALRVLRAEFDTAAEDFDEALALFRTLKDRQGQASVLRARGEMRAMRPYLKAAAAQDFDEAHTLFIQTGDEIGRATVLAARGALRRSENDVVRAAKDFNLALDLFKEHFDIERTADVLKARGELRRFCVELDKAAADFDAAFICYSRAHNLVGQVDVLLAQSELHRFREDITEAVRDFERALTLLCRMAVQSSAGRSHLQVVRRRYEADADLYRSLQDPIGLASALAELACLHAVANERDVAERLATEALDLARTHENRYASAIGHAAIEKIARRAIE
jgi:tetratricopeptide (TPR) repeat protein